MATYLQGLTDYIPQLQPFAPDYNFLGNMLQTKQSQYDSNWKQLSKTYGTLLDSPMLREDNIQQRDDFFKMIDGDIKRISGMDLSLQQNVDAADKVFDSFYQNQEMVKDMVYTKEYQNQLSIGENYRNCIDQKKCGGKYWDEGAQALHYRADEFKKAGRKDTLNMSPGRYVPMINVQEKTLDYVKDLMGNKDGAFGISTLIWSPDGRYQITTKNGAQLSISLDQLFNNQFGKDQDIIDMFQTKSYVNRKGFISQNTAKFGSEDLAEDAYFSQIDAEVEKTRQAAADALQKSIGTKSKVEVLENQIKTNGTTGGDDLAFDYEAALIDNAHTNITANTAQEELNLANSIFDAGDNRQMKRSRVDALLANSLMKQDFHNSSINIGNITSQTSVKEDPYAKSYYDFSLDMAKQKDLYERMDYNSMMSNFYDLQKQQALMETKMRGLHPGTPGGTGGIVFDAAYIGSSTGDTDQQETMRESIMEYTNTETSNAKSYVDGYANMLMGIVSNPSKPVDKDNAIKNLQAIYGQAEYNADGTVKTPGYDPKNGFVSKNGTKSLNPTDGFTSSKYGWRDLYKNAQDNLADNRSITEYQTYQKNGQKYVDGYNTAHELEVVATTQWTDNNKNVKDFKTGSFEGPDNDNWLRLFGDNNRLRTKEDYMLNYLNAHKNEIGTFTSTDKAPDRPTPLSVKGGQPTKTSVTTQNDLLTQGSNAYDKMIEQYKAVYNSGNSKGTDAKGNKLPLVQPLQGTYMFGKFGGGETSGAITMSLNTDEVAGQPMQGLMTFYEDVLRAGGNALFSLGNVKDATEISDPDDHAKTAYLTWISDLKSGKLTDAEKVESANLTYANTALTDASKEGMIIKYPASWLKKYQGTIKEKTWADDADLITKGTAIYIPKAGATNSFHTNFTEKPYDTILNFQSKVLSTPDGSSVTLMKRNSEGQIVMQGNLIAYGADGKPTGTPIAVNEIFGNEVGGQNVYTAANKWLQMVNDANQSAKDNPQGVSKIFNVKDLPSVRALLNQQAGDAAPVLSPTQIYMQNIQQFKQNQQ